MTTGEQPKKQYLTERTYVPVAAVVTISVGIILSMLWMNAQFDMLRNYVDDNFVRKGEFEAVKTDITEIKGDVKELLRTQGLR